jgi:hypothetical protein
VQIIVHIIQSEWAYIQTCIVYLGLNLVRYLNVGIILKQNLDADKDSKLQYFQNESCVFNCS